MNPAFPTRASTQNRPDSLIAGDAARVGVANSADKLAGVRRSLKHHTAEEFNRLWKENPGWQDQLRRACNGESLNGGVQWGHGFATWLLLKREAAALIAWLHVVGSDTVDIYTRVCAETLLEAVRSTPRIAGLKVKIALDRIEQTDPEIMALLAAAFRVNNGLDTLTLSLDSMHRKSLATLIDAVCLIKGLNIEATGVDVAPEAIHLFADLFSKNREINSFSLFDPESAQTRRTSNYTAAVNSLLAALKGQTRLKYLHLGGVPQTGQKALGEFIAESQALTSLTVGLAGDACTQTLVDAFSKNTTISFLALRVDSIENGMLPLIELIAKNKCRPQQFTLATSCSRDNCENLRYLCEMLRSNTTLNHFHWDCRDLNFSHLGLLGESLAKNTTLEHLLICRNHDGDLIPRSAIETAVKEHIPEFARHFAKNRTLTKFLFYPTASLFQRNKLSDPAIDAILKRNLAYQTYACSEGFIKGASCAFFNGLGLPAELGSVAAPFLLHQRPRTRAGSLALVNKASYHWAHLERRKEGARMIAGVLAAGAGPRRHATVKMIELLGRIAFLRQDYSIDQLREIAASPDFAPALVRLRSPEDYAHLVSRFGEAVGSELMGRLIALANREMKQMAAAPST
jgi:hypothetical protein